MENLPRQKSNKELTDEFYRFIDMHHPKEVSRHLRNILLDYMKSQVEKGLPVNFKNYLWQLFDLFTLLDNAADYIDDNLTARKT